MLWLALLPLVKMKLYLLKFCLSKSFLLRSYPLCLFIKNINSRKKMIICRQFQTMLCWYTYFEMICVFDGEVWEVFDWGSSCFWVYNPNFKISNRELVSHVSKQRCMEGKKTRNPAWKMSKYGFFSGPYFPVFGLNTGKYDQKKLRIWTLFTQWKLDYYGYLILSIE